MRISVFQPDPICPPARMYTWLEETGAQVDLIELFHQPRFPTNPHGIVVLGGRMDAQDDTIGWLAPLKQYLRSSTAPILGVCLGHQILAEAFGGQLRIADPKGPEDGPFRVHFHPAATDDPVVGAMTHAGSIMCALSHYDSVACLPPGAVELAYSEKYLQAFRLGNRWGVQFHPEVTPTIMGQWWANTGGDAKEMEARMRAVDSDIIRGGRGLTHGFVEFCQQLHSETR